MNDQALTIREAYTKGVGMLQAAGVSDAVRDSRTLLALALDMPESRLVIEQRTQVPPERLAAYLSMIEKRAAGVPLQHITGNTEFMGLPFIVRPGVLIPRQETEILVERALELLAAGGAGGAGLLAAGAVGTADVAEGAGPIRVLDLCCGSGIIGVSIAKLAAVKADEAANGEAAAPALEVTCSDISTDAIYLAHANAELNGVDGAMRFVRGDLVEPFAGDAAEPDDASVRFSIVCCNPPYIPTAVIDTLQREVRDHDPALALDGGLDGLNFYRRIATEVPEVMTPGGSLILEIGSEQREAVAAILQKSGIFDSIDCLRDLAGRDRVMTAVRR